MGSDRLRQAIRDPRAWVDDEAAARAGYLLCRHVLEQIDDAARTTGASVLLVKGAALAHTVYPKPWLREMGDIDLLVQPAVRPALVAELERRHFLLVPPPPDRAVSAARLGDLGLRFVHGAARFSIDVHARLDKLVARPIPYDAVRNRSVSVDSLPTLRAPALEDHALLVALHASSSDLDHPRALIDLELLLGAGLDQQELARRATAWRLASALHVCLTQLRALGSRRISDALIRTTRPGRARRWLLGQSGYFEPPTIEPADVPAAREVRRGARWVAHQTLVRDDPVRWLVGLGHYGGLRLADRVVGRAAR